MGNEAEHHSKWEWGVRRKNLKSSLMEEIGAMDGCCCSIEGWTEILLIVVEAEAEWVEPGFTAINKTTFSSYYSP